MKTLRITTLFLALSMTSWIGQAQTDSITKVTHSVNAFIMQEYQNKIAEIENLRIADSIKKATLEAELNSLKTTDNLKKEELQQQLQEIENSKKERLASKKARIEALKETAKGFPVIGVMQDTLFFIYSKIGATTQKERAASISKKIYKLYDDDFLKIDSILVNKAESTVDINYGETIIMSVSEVDALWNNTTLEDLAKDYQSKIKASVLLAKNERSWTKTVLRFGLMLLVIAFAYMLIRLIGIGYKRLIASVLRKKDGFLKNLSYKNYTFLSAEQELQIILFLIKVFRWTVFIALLYIILPIIFSIFPFTRNWADALFSLIWVPFKSILGAIWSYLPNLFSILVIYFLMRYLIRFVHYIFKEIESEKLVINGFHSDWAMPTNSIIKFLLYAFMFVLIFPHLPGSNSDVFKGVSVFVGILFSLGSSTAIANMVAGLVITYMRPFKIGDRIKIGEIIGDVVEKTLLVTRIRTVKNEIITIPNSSILSSNTTNYSSEALDNGLIIHTTVTIGYDVPWRDMHEALIEAVLRTELLLKEPKPFVYQTSLDDFYVSYQINAYTKDAGKQGGIYSDLHQNIQDVCNEKGIEILSPHYRAERDGNRTTIPNNYLPEDYKTPGFVVNVTKETK
jgi:small-conductance mechanosensitive channel